MFIKIRVLTIKFENLPPCIYIGSAVQTVHYGFITLVCRCLRDVLVSTCGGVLLSGAHHCGCVFLCAVVRMSELHTLEQLINIKLLVKLGKSGSEIRDIVVQVYGNNAMKKTAVYKWVKCFSEGRKRTTDKERSASPVTSRTEENTAKIHRLVHQN